MPHSVARQTFDRLARVDAPHCVSIFVPLDPHHPDEHLAHTTFKDLIGSARDQLAGLSNDEIERLLERPLAALSTSLTATSGGSALAFFSAPGFSEQLSLRGRVEPIALVADRFEVGPLIASVDPDVGGHVLTVGAEEVRLYRIADSSLEECQVPGFEHSIDEALWFDRVERHAGAHSGQAGREGRRATVTHGSGAQNEDRKDRLERFYHHVDQAVLNYLGDRRSQPLFLVGTAPEVARFQHVTRHSHPVALAGGSPTRLSHKDLQDRVLAAAHSSTVIVDDVLQRFALLNGTGRASDDLATILTAASEGRIDTLLVGDTSPIWGTRDNNGEITFADPGTPAGAKSELLNEAVSNAWRTGANVRLAPHDALPAGAQAAAVFRY